MANTQAEQPRSRTRPPPRVALTVEPPVAGRKERTKPQRDLMGWLEPFRDETHSGGITKGPSRPSSGSDMTFWRRPFFSDAIHGTAELCASVPMAACRTNRKRA
ncbi:hypothetical protein GGTG_00481 [Gaeumannomyces tritici R3-111a-1]|uniref:Uncharacterized protein n=1 Tax=Gaeumannomyces tritici (strain R3-111a-1) TaxID=644352 RepID=J3NGU2_GAET3|nr:hypothetical protein GGTG_00481 [Gaeumannomyces tritici R3-111a-1]EJT80482.1 hypothetical protein GGTG_00481 [Gaeumannomyces tritici R3-111a-1]